MPRKPNYSYEKRKKEADRQKRKAEKLAAKRNAKADQGTDETANSGSTPPPTSSEEQADNTP
jgi:hypothetical protein